MKRTLLILLLGVICALFSTKNLKAQSTSVYIAAHPDDWQLFMNPNAYNDVKNPNNKVVFLHITAGDVGYGTGNTYYLAREEGSLRGIRFIENTCGNGGNWTGLNMNKTTVNVNGHNILKYTYKNAVAYFLRLPDGGDGTGYPMYNYTSLEKLYKGTITAISAIDNSTTYTSLSDLKTTLKAIVDVEAAATAKTFNLADTDVSINPYDHSDHIHSSLIVQSVLSTMSNVKVNLYVDYYSDSKPQNLTDEEYLINVGTWGATTSGVTDHFYQGGWDAGHNKWATRQYYRTTTLGSGGGGGTSTTNIALNKTTTASGCEGGSQCARNAVDGNYSLSNYWAASPYAQWWQVDLGDRYSLSKVAVFNYHDGSRYYQYDVQASLDGVTWTRVVDFNANRTPATSAGNAFPLAGVTARYLRVNMNYNSANKGVHIIEFQAFGKPATSSLSSTSTTVNAVEQKTSINQQAYNLQLYPNPGKRGSSIKIAFDLPDDEQVQIELLDTNGQSILQQSHSLKAGTNEIELPSKDVGLGMHFVKLKINGEVLTKKVYLE